MTASIVPIYAALLVLLFVYLSARTIIIRRQLQIAVGDSGNPVMLRAMRVHGNFAEYVPLALIALYMVEMQGAPAFFVHLLCMALLVGRASHAFGVSQAHELFKFRIFGIIATFTVLLCAAFYLLLQRFF